MPGWYCNRVMIREANLSDLSCLSKKFIKNKYNHKYREWLCENGLKAAIRRKEVFVEESYGTIIAACRVYRRKKDNGLSIYQRFGNINNILNGGINA